MNDSGSTRPEQGTGTSGGDAEVFVPPARQGERADPGQGDAGQVGSGQDADVVAGSDLPGEPPTPLEGYERV